MSSVTLDFYGLQIGNDRMRHQVAPLNEGDVTFCLKCGKEVVPELHLAPRGTTAEYNCPHCTWQTVKGKTRVPGDIDYFLYAKGFIIFRKEIKIKRRDRQVPAYIIPVLVRDHKWFVSKNVDGDDYLTKYYYAKATGGVEALSVQVSFAGQEERVIEDATEDALNSDVASIFKTQNKITFFRGHERNVPTEIPEDWHLIGRRNRSGQKCTVLYARIGASIEELYEAMQKVVATRSETIELTGGKIVIKSTHSTRWHETENGLRKGIEAVLGRNISIVSVGHIAKPDKVDTTNVENIIKSERANPKKKKLTRQEIAQLRKDKAELERLESAERLRKSIARSRSRAVRN